MIFGGLQKLSLIDFPEKVCAVAFTQGCLFRCRYCHNPDLIPTKLKGDMDEGEILNYLESKKEFLDGVCITGGEPTLHADLPEFIKKIKALGLAVKLDTNGINPKMVSDLIKDNIVDYFAMDLKHRWENYNDIANTKSPKILTNCKKTFKLIQKSGIGHEFRTTVLPEVHKDEDFEAMAGYLLPEEKYFIQDISFTKNLDPKIDKTKKLDVNNIVKKLKKMYPKLIIEGR